MNRNHLVVTFCLLLALACLARPAAAQGGCEDEPLLPCGPLLWPLPSFPVINSPTPYTPIPTVTPMEITPTPTATSTPTATPTTTPTPVDSGDQHDNAATLAADTGDIIATLDLNDSEIDGEDLPGVIDQITGYARLFFGYAKGLNLFNVTGTSGVVGFLLLALSVVILTKVITAVIPMLGAVLRWVMTIINTIAQFLPF